MADSSLSEAELLSSLLYTGETGPASLAELRSLQRLLQDLGLDSLVEQCDIQLVQPSIATGPNNNYQDHQTQQPQPPLTDLAQYRQLDITQNNQELQSVVLFAPADACAEHDQALVELEAEYSQSTAGSDSYQAISADRSVSMSRNEAFSEFSCEVICYNYTMQDERMKNECEGRKKLAVLEESPLNATSTKKEFYCDFCSFSSPTFAALNRHSEVHPDNFHLCEHCDYSTKKLINLRRHYQTRHKEFQFSKKFNKKANQNKLDFIEEEPGYGHGTDQANSSTESMTITEQLEPECLLTYC